MEAAFFPVFDNGLQCQRRTVVLIRQPISDRRLVVRIVALRAKEFLSRTGRVMTHQRSTDGASSEEIKRLLARTPIIRTACELDLLVFFHRHPRALLTSEQVASFLGYDMKKIAKAIEAFVEGGVLERTQNPTHAARLYVLVLNDPQGGGLTSLLRLASTRQGRQDILDLLGAGQSETPLGAVQEKRRLHAIA